MKSTALTIILLAVLVANFDIECKQNATKTKSSTTRRARPKGVSRIRGGEPLRPKNLNDGAWVSILPWLGTLWIPEESDFEGADNRLAGHTIQISPTAFIASHKAMGQLIRHTYDPSHPSGGGAFSLTKTHYLRTPDTVDSKKGIDNEPEVHEYLEHTGIDHGLPRGFELYHHGPSVLGLDNTYKGPLPVLETNKTEWGTDCHLYGWSKLWFRGPQEKSLRRLVKIPVKVHPSHSNCPHACKLVFTGENSEFGIGNICPGTTDIGAPVLCGKERKLTYMVGVPIENGCDIDFMAEHVPQFQEQLMKALKVSG